MWRLRRCGGSSTRDFERILFVIASFPDAPSEHARSLGLRGPTDTTIANTTTTTTAASSGLTFRKVLLGVGKYSMEGKISLNMDATGAHSIFQLVATRIVMAHTHSWASLLLPSLAGPNNTTAISRAGEGVLHTAPWKTHRRGPVLGITVSSGHQSPAFSCTVSLRAGVT